MELTNSFPPADAFIQQLLKIEYKKHLNNLITFTLFICAVVYVLSQKFMEWYSECGKDAIIQFTHKIRNFLQVCYTWCRSEGYPNLMNLMGKIQQTYQNWQDLVTV